MRYRLVFISLALLLLFCGGVVAWPWLADQWQMGWQVVNCGEATTTDGSYAEEVSAIERCAAQALQNHQAFIARTCYVRTDSGVCRAWKGIANGQVFFARGSTGWGNTTYDEFELCSDPTVKVIGRSSNIALVCPSRPGPDYETFFIPWASDSD